MDQDELLYQDALDETVTVATAELTDSDSSLVGTDSTTTTYQQDMEIDGVNDDLLHVHGIPLGSKSEGTTRLIMENANGFNTRIKQNDKLEKAKN